MQKKLYGLVLAGGKSSRMGQDKGNIDYHGKPQREYLADILEPVCKKVFISCRKEQMIESHYPLLFDNYDNQGPIAALMTAFEHFPNVSWLVVACDLAMINNNAIEFLIQNRNTNAIATAFQHPETMQIEPLIAIWEAASYPIVQSYFKNYKKSPFKILKENQVQLVVAERPNWLLNINTELERKALIDRKSEE